MYRILNEPQPLQDGSATIHFDGIATTFSQEYLYPITQDVMVFKNMVDAQMTVTVGGTSTVVPGGNYAVFFNVDKFAVITPESASHQFFTVDSRTNITNFEKVEFRNSDPTDLAANPTRIWARTDTGELKYTVDGVNINKTASAADLANKANQIDLDETNAEVATKADQSDLDATNAQVVTNTNKIASNTTAIAANATAISNIGNASPKGVYATLTALQAAFPTGTTGVYVVQADGKWYYWNGTAWTAGGTYQGTTIADNYITPNMIQYKGLKRFRGTVFPLITHTRTGFSIAPNDQVKNAVLDVKLYNPDRTKIYHIGFIGNASVISGVAYTGITLHSASADWTSDILVIPHTVPQNIGVGPLTGVHTLRYLFGTNQIIEVTVDFDEIPSGGSLFMDNSSSSGYDCVVDETCYYEYTPPPTNTTVGLMSAYKSGNLVKVASKYDKNNDILFRFLPVTENPNNLVSFSEIGYYPNTSSKVSQNIITDPAGYVILDPVFTDWVGPYTVGVVSNANGDKPTSWEWTGGFHGYNNDATGSATARTVSYEVYFDRIAPTNGVVYDCREVLIKVVNNIQSSQTKKVDGTGREVLTETVYYLLKPDGFIKVWVEIEALEAIIIRDYMGLQVNTRSTWNGQILFDDDPNKKWTTITDVSVYSGSKSTGSECQSFTVRKDIHHILTTLEYSGLGKRKNVADTAFLAYTQNYNKAYFKQIYLKDLTLQQNEVVKWYGSWKFYGDNQ